MLSKLQANGAEALERACARRRDLAMKGHTDRTVRQFDANQLVATASRRADGRCFNVRSSYDRLTGRLQAVLSIGVSVFHG